MKICRKNTLDKYGKNKEKAENFFLSLFFKDFHSRKTDHAWIKALKGWCYS